LKVQPKYNIIIPFCYDTGLAVLTTSPSSTTRDSIGHLLPRVFVGKFVKENV
jgi:hypothetical protein